MGRDLHAHARTWQQVQRLQQAGLLREGDFWEGKQWNGTQWVPKNSRQEGDVNVAVDPNIPGAAINVAAGLMNRGDTNAAAGQRDIAALNRESAGRQQADAQRGYQIANRDERVEAAKDAGAAGAAAGRNTVAQLDSAAGGGAAALAGQKASGQATNDTYSQQLGQHRQRADSQFQVGESMQAGAEAAQVAVASQETAAGEMNRATSETNAHNNMAAKLATSPSQTPQSFDHQGVVNAVPGLNQQLRDQLGTAADAQDPQAWNSALDQIIQANPGSKAMLDKYRIQPKRTISDIRTKRIISVLKRRF